MSGTVFSRQEAELTGLLLQERRLELARRLWNWGWLSRTTASDGRVHIKPVREASEWQAKLASMGLALEWNKFDSENK